MTTIFNRGSGGTNGAAVTTANSGGTGETPFDAVQDLSNIVVNWSNLNVDPDASLGVLFQANPSAGQASYTEWSTSLVASPTAAPLNVGASYVFPASPGSEIPIMRGTSAGTQRFRVALNASRNVVLRDSTNAQLGLSSQLALNERYWIEVQVTGVDSPPGGTAEMRIYDDANALVATVGPFSAADLGGPVGEVRFGFGASVSPTSTTSYYVSRMAASTDGWINPFGLTIAGVDLGPVVGAVTSAAATATYKLSGSDGKPTRLVVSTAPTLATSPVYSAITYVDADGVIKLSVAGLTPGTQYYCGVEIGGVLQADGRGQFKTLPVENSAASFCVAFGSGQDTGSDSDTYDAIRTYTGAQGKPLAWLHLGNYGSPQWASAVGQDTVRTHYEDQLTLPKLAALHAAVPFVYTPANKDLAAAPVNGDSAAVPDVAAAYRQWVPSYTLPHAEAFYHAFTIGRVRFIMLDLWSQRSPTTDADGPAKTLIGTSQYFWLDNELQRSEPVKVICSDIWRGENSASGGWGAYLWEFDFINDMLDNRLPGRVLIASGGRLALAADNGTAANTRGRPNVLAGPFNSVSQQPAEAWSAGYWYSYQGSPVQEAVDAFGVLEVADTGGPSISITFRGITSDGVQRVTYTQAFDLFEKRSFSGAVGPAGTARRSTTRPVGGAVAPASTLAKRSPRAFAGQVLPVGIARRLLGRRLSGVAAPGGGLARRVGRPLVGSVAPSAGLGSFRLTRGLSGAVALAGGSSWSFTRRLAGLLAPAGAVSGRAVGKGLSGAVVPVGSLSVGKSLLRAFEGSMALVAARLRTTQQNRGGEVSPVASVGLGLSRGLSGRVSPDGGLRKATERTEDGSVAPAGAATRAVSIGLGGAILGLVGGVGRMLTRRLSGGVAPGGALDPAAQVIVRPEPAVSVMIDPLPLEVEVPW